MRGQLSSSSLSRSGLSTSLLSGVLHAASGGGGPGLLTLNTPIFVEGDSNTDAAYLGTTWTESAISLSGPRVWLPPGAYLASAGGTVAYQSQGNSMVDRQATMEALLAAHPGKKIVMWMIGTNPEAGQLPSYAATAELADYLTALKAVDPGNVTTICVLPLYNTNLGNVERIDAQKTWAEGSDLVDYVLDAKEITPDLGTMGEPDTHMSQAQSFAVAEAVADLLATIVAPGMPYDHYEVDLWSGGIDTFSATSGTGYSGDFADDWTVVRQLGNGTITGAETTLGGKPAQQLTVTGGDNGNDTIAIFRYTVARDVLAGTVLDAFARIAITASTAQTIPYLGILAGNGNWPNNPVAGLDVDKDNWADMVYRSYVAALDADVTELTFEFQLRVAPGETVTVVYAAPVIAEAGVSEATRPVAETAPVLNPISAGGTITYTPGTYTGLPEPEVVGALYFFDAGDAIGDAVPDGYVPVEGDRIAVREQGVSVGGVSDVQFSNIVTVGPEAAVVIAWDSSIVKSGTTTWLEYSDSDRTVSAAETIGGQGRTRGVDALTGKAFFGIRMTAQVNMVGLGDSGVGINSAAPGTDRVGKSVGYIYHTGGTQFVGNPLADGQIAWVAVDIDAGLFWIRQDDGLWNEDAEADPVEGVGGYSLAGLEGEVYAFVQLNNNAAASADLLGTSALAGGEVPPGGFSYLG